MGLPSSFSQLPCDSKVITPFLSCFCSTQWNKIEHRLFCHITQTWRARPLTSRIAVVESIAATTTKTGLKVESALDTRHYQKGLKVSKAEMKSLKGTSKNGHRSSGIPDLPTNDSGLFSVRFCAVHPKDADDCRLLQFFEVPLSRS